MQSVGYTGISTTLTDVTLVRAQIDYLRRLATMMDGGHEAEQTLARLDEIRRGAAHLLSPELSG